MTDPDYELLIIGGGPAGSCAAAFARQHGLRTLVVEKSSFPRFHIGESLLPAGNHLLRETGVWPKIEAAGFMPKFGAEFHTADGSVGKSVVFSNSLIPELDRTYQVERARFDALLLDHARELGADVRMETTVRHLESFGAGGHRVTITDTGGTRTLTVPWVIDSTGRDASLMTEQKRSLEPSPFPKRLAIYSHLHGVARAAGKEAGNIIVVRLDGGWFWLIPLDQQRTSVGLVTTIEAFRTAGQTPERFFNDAIARSAKLRQLLAAATPVMPFQVTSDYTYFRRSLASDRLLLAGDAAGFFDPVFSSGVYMAMLSAKKAVQLVARAHAERRSLSAREQRRYTRALKRHAGVFQKLIAAFYDDDAFEVFMCQRIPWNMSGGLTSIVAGHAELTWPLWWRFQLFMLICRLQRRWKLVKPEDLRPLESVDVCAEGETLDRQGSTLQASQ